MYILTLGNINSNFSTNHSDPANVAVNWVDSLLNRVNKWQDGIRFSKHAYFSGADHLPLARRHQMKTSLASPLTLLVRLFPIS